MPVIRGGFVFGIAGPAITALGCWSSSGELVFLGLGVLRRVDGDRDALARGGGRDVPARAPRPRHVATCSSARSRARSSARSIFGPLFAGRDLTPDELAWPWLGSSLFALAGLLDLVPRPPRPEGALEGLRHRGRRRRAPPAPLRRDPAPAGRADARMLAAVASFAVMVGVMNLAGYVAVGHGHEHGDVFTIISAAHRRHVRARARRRRPRRPDRPRPSMAIGLAADGRLERSRSSGWTGSRGCRSRSSGSGSAGTSPSSPRRPQLVYARRPGRARPAGRLLRPRLELHGAALALAGGVVYTRRRLGAARRLARRPWRRVPALWILLATIAGRRAARPPLLRDEDLQRQDGRNQRATGTSSTPRARRSAGSRPRSPTACAARASRSTRRTSTRATSSSS